ncbi:MAG: hypothetical protein U5K74_13565 [Gemmatimonadaceae bacterium]|nr:hypothetical protein [Gemmatimonadaceae bacterium]
MLRPLFAALCLVACARGESPQADSGSVAVTPEGTPYAYERIPLDTARRPGAVIDSVFPMPEMMRRFRDGLPEVRALHGGAESRRELAERFAAALAARDRATLGQLTLSRAEFAYLYFPNTADAASDNGLPPTLRWDQITLASEKGIARALERVGGRGALTLIQLDCPNPPVSQGPVTLHDGCSIRLKQAEGTEFDGRLFGPIMEYAGTFKFIGYANDM